MEVRSVVNGRVLRVLVKAGDSVSQGTELIVIESMKMELPVAAPATGKVDMVSVGVGDSVQIGTPLVVLG